MDALFSRSTHGPGLPGQDNGLGGLPYLAYLAGQAQGGKDHQERSGPDDLAGEPPAAAPQKLEDPSRHQDGVGTPHQDPESVQGKVEHEALQENQGPETGQLRNPVDHLEASQRQVDFQVLISGNQTSRPFVVKNGLPRLVQLVVAIPQVEIERTRLVTHGGNGGIALQRLPVVAGLVETIPLKEEPLPGVSPERNGNQNQEEQSGRRRFHRECLRSGRDTSSCSIRVTASRAPAIRSRISSRPEEEGANCFRSQVRRQSK